MNEGRKHHDMGRCWCGELHAAEHVLSERVVELEKELADARAQIAWYQERDFSSEGPP